MISKTRALLRLGTKKIHLMGIDLIAQWRDGEIRLVAASLSFSTILSLVPFLAVILAMFKFVGGDDLLYARAENLLLLYFKEAAGIPFVKAVKLAIHNIHARSLGFSGAVVLLFTTFRLMNDMEHGVHRVWNQKNSRPFAKRFLMYLFMVVVVPVFLALYVGVRTLIRLELGRRYLPGTITGYLVLGLVLYFAYRYIPDLKVKAKSAFFSALVATAGLGIVQNSFTWVTVKFFRFNSIYGSFAFLPLFLIWILTIWYVILGGVAICASTQRRQLLEKDLT